MTDAAAKSSTALATTALIEMLADVVTASGSSRCRSLTASEASQTTVTAARTASTTTAAAIVQTDGPPVTAARSRPSGESPGCNA